MKRRGRRQRAAQARPFTIHVVVEGDVVEVEGGAEKRGRGRPPATYVHKQIAVLVRTIRRLAPAWLDKQVRQALPEDAPRSKSHLLDILRRHPEPIGSEITVGVHSRIHEWLWSFLRAHSAGDSHPMEERIDKLIQQEDQLDPRQLDELVKHDPSTEH